MASETDANELRLLSNEERNEVERSVMRPIRRGLWALGIATIILFFLAVQRGKIIHYVPAVASASLLLVSWKDIRIIKRDLHSGTVREVMGSVQKGNANLIQGVMTGLVFPLWPLALFARSMADLLSRIGLKRRGGMVVSAAGRPLTLIRSDSSETVCVSDDIYRELGDGALIRATLLPSSRFAFRVRRCRLDTL